MASPVQARKVFFLSMLLFPLLASAANYADVPANHTFYGAIMALSERGIVKGDPSGTFRPDATINRAELLTLLYRVNGRKPNRPETKCFHDVPAGSWYEAAVCDAAAMQYVSGYPDKMFRPEREVNRVEALKMIHTVLGFSLEAGTQELYADVDAQAWFVPYVVSALKRGILPVAGQEGPLLSPSALLTRGEAAAYIANALGLAPVTPTSEHSASSATSILSSSASTRSVHSKSSASSVSVKAVSFPFQDEGAFAGKKERVYRFSLKEAVTARFSITVEQSSGLQGATCRLFKLESETGLSYEYYLGQTVGKTCTLRVALEKGDYQLDIRPLQTDALFALETSNMKGDGNDGFREAIVLAQGVQRIAEIAVDDIADWYSFSLTRAQQMTVELTNGENVMCVIYPLENVDLSGFTGPECNIPYDYPRGSYVIGVQRRNAVSEKVSYMIRLR